MCPTCFPCCGKWHGGCPCRPAVAYPKGDEWEEAYLGFQPMLDDASNIALKEAPGSKCCGCPDVHEMKRVLDADWTTKANDYLSEHKLGVEVCAFYTSDGHGATPHLVLQFHKIITLSKK